MLRSDLNFKYVADVADDDDDDDDAVVVLGVVSLVGSGERFHSCCRCCCSSVGEYDKRWLILENVDSNDGAIVPC